MADIQRTDAELLARFADNNIGGITAQDIRDLVVSKLNSTALTDHELLADPHPQYETSPEAQDKVDAHANRIDNPHSVTAEQTGADPAGTAAAHAALTGTSVHGLGTASTATLTTSATDATVGRVLKVGDFGVGSSQIPTGSDFNGLIISGTYRFGNTESNRPFDYGTVFVSAYSAAGTTQLAISIIDFRVSFRRFNVTWSEWSELYSEQNILGTVSQSAGVPTGAIIERGSNSNGEYVKFADGTLICTNSNVAITTNPSTFVGTVTDIDSSKLRIGRWY